MCFEEWLKHIQINSFYNNVHTVFVPMTSTIKDSLSYVNSMRIANCRRNYDNTSSFLRCIFPFQVVLHFGVSPSLINKQLNLFSSKSGLLNSFILDQTCLFCLEIKIPLRKANMRNIKAFLFVTYIFTKQISD